MENSPFGALQSSLSHLLIHSNDIEKSKYKFVCGVCVRMCVCTCVCVCMYACISFCIVVCLFIYQKLTKRVFTQTHKLNFQGGLQKCKIHTYTSLGNWGDLSITGTLKEWGSREWSESWVGGGLEVIVAVIYCLMEVREERPNSGKNANMNSAIQSLHWGPVESCFATIFLFL